MPLEEKAIQTKEVKEKLKNLRKYLPGQEQIVYDFAAKLADRLNPELVPAGFNTAAELLLYDAQKGVDGYTGQPLGGHFHLIGYLPQLYAALRMSIPDIAEAVCPEDFAKGVKEFQDKVYEIARNKT